MALSFTPRPPTTCCVTTSCSRLGLDMALGNVRPLIPLNVDPPQHSKYRKLLDPLFAPKRMDEQEDDITPARQRLHRRVRRPRRVQLHRGVRGAVPVVGVPRPDGPARGRAAACSSACATASCTPRRSTRRARSTPRRDARCNGRPARRSTTTSATSSTSAPSSPTDDILPRSSPPRSTASKLTRDEILDICFLFLIAGLDTVSDSLTCFYAFLATHPEHRQQIVDDPSIIPTAVEELLRWESPVPIGVPRGRDPGRRAARTARRSPRARR